MSSPKTNIELLEEAGILDPAHFSAEDTKVIESITPEEIEVLIRLRKKLGPAPMAMAAQRPNFPV